MDKTSSDSITRAELAVNAIVDYIATNHLKPGDRLPSERELAEMIGVTRPTVREAAFALSVMNIIETRQQSGMYIATPNSKTKLDYFKIQLQAGQFKATDIYELRRVLESECAAVAAKRITPEQLNTIKEAIFDVSIENPDRFAAADNILHKTIHAATDNIPLQLIMETVGLWSISSRQYTNSFSDVRKLVHYDHLQIFEAISRHDSEGARIAMDRHISNLEQIDKITVSVLAQHYSQLLKENISIDALKQDRLN